MECKFELRLESQMPMIHFQSEQCGVTLRASEAKPKLDRFIIAALERETGKSLKELKKDVEYKSIFIDAETNDALDYKMQITVPNAPQEVEIGTRDSYSIYYGNMGTNTIKKYGVNSDTIVTIICFKKKLMELIQANIEKFFLVTNFGTMQNKGFGSFSPNAWVSKAKEKGINDWKKEVAKYYKEIGAVATYCMVFDTNKPKSEMTANISDEIKRYYSILKSGQNHGKYIRSYIYTYMHEKHGIGNEKAWMKQNELAPILYRPENEKKHQWVDKDTQYYVRALLGVGEAVEFADRYKVNDRGKEVLDGRSKRPVKIASKASDKDKLERVASPIYFKVIKNVLFIVAFEVPEEIYDASFTFASSGFTKYNPNPKAKAEMVARKTMTLKTPSKAALKGKFDMEDFLDSYMPIFNNTGGKVKVVKINA